MTWLVGWWLVRFYFSFVLCHKFGESIAAKSFAMLSHLIFHLEAQRVQTFLIVVEGV